MTLSKKKTIELLFIVNGQPHKRKVRLNFLTRSIISDLLNETGNIGQIASEWELRDSYGHLLDQNMILQNQNLKIGQTLFLNVKAGIGG